jgi:hypothetical protein
MCEGRRGGGSIAGPVTRTQSTIDSKEGSILYFGPSPLMSAAAAIGMVKAQTVTMESSELPDGQARTLRWHADQSQDPGRGQ